MSTIHLRVEPLVGSGSREIIQDALTLSIRVGVPIVFDFNGVEVIVRPDSDPERLYESCQHALEMGLHVVTDHYPQRVPDRAGTSAPRRSAPTTA